ncbi:beta-1,4-galactosyltransferase 3 [Platysternon megacephalum]|uniref:Beta-1,4-galactosyltransferase 3 n=1 Tax=Platysternon megacephalum TaxID=55544 RepID=A0A4D9DXW7_9SAUR|nr:beta-1,4-galactosyltransferase 3 [Platysternon megacephalum]
MIVRKSGAKSSGYFNNQTILLHGASLSLACLRLKKSDLQHPHLLCMQIQFGMCPGYLIQVKASLFLAGGGLSQSVSFLEGREGVGIGKSSRMDSGHSSEVKSHVQVEWALAVGHRRRP